MQLTLPLAPAAFGTQHPAPGTRHVEPSTQHPAPGTQHVEPRTQHPEPSTHYVRHPRARRYVIRVRSDGTVRVTIPRGGSKREGEDFARRQAWWIDKQRARLAREEPAAREAAPEIEREARERAKSELPVRLLELAAAHGLRVTRVSVRNQQWRWGSCSRSGHICLNWRLVDMPSSVRDYVMIHELMHVKRMDHSPRFWKLVAAACPDYEAARAWLRHFGRR